MIKTNWTNKRQSAFKYTKRKMITKKMMMEDDHKEVGRTSREKSSDEVCFE